MANRIVSVTFEILDPGKVRWLWDSMMLPDRERGVRAIYIAEGQRLAKADVLEEVIGWMLERSWGDFRLVEDVRKSDLSAEARAYLMGKLDEDKPELVVPGGSEAEGREARP